MKIMRTYCVISDNYSIDTILSEVLVMYDTQVTWVE